MFSRRAAGHLHQATGGGVISKKNNSNAPNFFLKVRICVSYCLVCVAKNSPIIFIILRMKLFSLFYLSLLLQKKHLKKMKTTQAFGLEQRYHRCGGPNLPMDELLLRDLNASGPKGISPKKPSTGTHPAGPIPFPFPYTSKGFLLGVLGGSSHDLYVVYNHG